MEIACRRRDRIEKRVVCNYATIIPAEIGRYVDGVFFIRRKGSKKILAVPKKENTK
jgi:hypothetical protein